MSDSVAKNTENNVSQPIEAPVKKTKKRSQERFMMLLTLIFFIGVAVYALIPEGELRGLVMTSYTIAVMWVLLKFAF